MYNNLFCCVVTHMTLPQFTAHQKSKTAADPPTTLLQNKPWKVTVSSNPFVLPSHPWPATKLPGAIVIIPSTELGVLLDGLIHGDAVNVSDRWEERQPIGWSGWRKGEFLCLLCCLAPNSGQTVQAGVGLSSWVLVPLRLLVMFPSLGGWQVQSLLEVTPNNNN